MATLGLWSNPNKSDNAAREKIMNEEQEYPYWNRVYVAVVVFLVIVISALWMFMKTFE